MAVVYICKLGLVPACKLLVLTLCRGSFNMTFAHCRLFRGVWPSVNTARPVKAVTVKRGIVDHGTVDISVMYKGAVYVHYGCIIPKPVAFPASAAKAEAAVAKAIINTAVKAYMRSPVAHVEAVAAALKAPVTGCP
jgi:hypothetical protein